MNFKKNIIKKIEIKYLNKKNNIVKKMKTK